MENTNNTFITVKTQVQAPLEKVWEVWTKPEHIVRWNAASSDWHTHRAVNDLRDGGRFLARMESRDGTMGFDFSGVYHQVIPFSLIEYLLDDGRRVRVSFEGDQGKTSVTETFEAEHTHSAELQQAGWQAILDNFKIYAENAIKFLPLHFEIEIFADNEKVYSNMLDDKYYREWTAAFNPSSRFEGNWEKGSKILFFGENPDGTQGGMVSRIRANIPGCYVSIEHLGMISNREEITSGNEVDAWSGAMENYSFTEKDGMTRVAVDVDVIPEFVEYFMGTWPDALTALKSICESIQK